MDLPNLLNVGSDGPTSVIISYLGHHGTVLLGSSCASLHEMFLQANAGGCWWKQLVLGKLQTSKELDFSTIHEEKVDWRSLSYLAHTNLRRRTALACLGLPKEYQFDSPFNRNGYVSTFDVDLNQNQNLCLLMGNNSTEDFRAWKHLPVRYVEEKRSLGYRYNKPVTEWEETELQLLSKAGHHAMKRLGEQVKATLETIRQETLNIPPIAHSGNLPGLEPQLRVVGSGCTLGLPLNPDKLTSIIQDERSSCRESTYGQKGTRRLDRKVRLSWSMDLGKDVDATNATFRGYLKNLPVGNDLPRMWSAIQDLAMQSGKALAIGELARISVKPHKMLIYGEGGRFKRHRDGQRGPGHIGTLVIVLPVAEKEGAEFEDGQRGELVLRCQKGTDVETQTHRPPLACEHATWHIFTIGTAHEVTPNRGTYRVALTYQLWLEETNAIPRSPNLNLLAVMGQSIQRWLATNSMEELVEFLLPLQSNYGLSDKNTYMPAKSEEEYGDFLDLWSETREQRLKEDKLVGQDAWMYRGLVDAFKTTDMKVELEYVAVTLDVPGYPQGVVRRRLHFQKAESRLPLEDQSKIVWLNQAGGQPLIDCYTPYDRERVSRKTILVASISISHEKFRCRGERQFGSYGSSSHGWVHPDDSGQFRSD